MRISRCVSSILLFGGVAEALLSYVGNSLFDPTIVGGTAWPRRSPASHEFSELGGNWYNPGATVLPSSVRTRLSRETGREVMYLMSFRRNLDSGGCLCMTNPTNRSRPLMPTNESAPEDLVEFGQNITDVSMPESFVLLDFSKKVLFPTLHPISDDPEALRYFLNSDDFRLERVDPRRILAHGNTREHRDTFYNNMYAFFWIEIIDATQFRVSLVNHPQIEANPWKNSERAQNIGLLWNNRPRETFKVIWWIQKFLDVQVGVPPQGRSHAEEHQVERDTELELTNGLEGDYKSPLHGNGSPVSLNDIVPGLSILAGHTWLDAGALAMKRGRVFNATRWHNTYMSQFVIFKNKAPFETVAVSPAFCFPSVSPESTTESPLCDIIQFITGFTRIPHTSNVLITYGINDCESAWIEIPIIDLIRFTDPNIVRDLHLE